MEGETNATVTDHEIARGVHFLLNQSLSDPLRYGAVNSLNDVVQLLSSNLGIDLSHKTGLILDQVNLFHHLQPPHPPPPYTVVPGDHLHSLQFQLQHQNRAHANHFYSHAPPPNTYAPPLTVEDHKVAAVTPASQAKDHVHVSPPVKVSKQSTQAGAKRRGGAGGLNKLCGVSPELQVVVGESTMARTEIVKQLWAYIRKHNLQDPSNKRKIICDEALRVVLETDCTDMFKMNKLLAKHILPLDPSKDSVKSKRQKVDVEVTAEPTEGTSAMISDALALFLGTTKKVMLASEAKLGVLEYIRVNSLEDPSSMTVICDEKLEGLFGCECVPVMEIDDMLARRHLFQSW